MNRKRLMVLIIVCSFLSLFTAFYCGCGETLSHDEIGENALETAGSFMRMCKEGRAEEAFDTYLPEVDRSGEDAIPSFFNEIAEYEMRGPEIIVDECTVWIFLTTTDGEKITIQFECSKDGRDVKGFGYSMTYE